METKLCKFKVHPQQNTIVEVEEAQESRNVGENLGGDLEQGMIQKILLPLTFSMQILGLYFERPDKQKTTKQVWRFYSMFISVIMWLNTIRIFTIFTGDDRLQIILLNIASVLLLASGALLQTSCYRASLKGNIPEVLQTFNKDMSSRWAKRLRVHVVLGVGTAWGITLFTLISGAFQFFTDQGYLSTMIAPFNTYILNSNPLTLNVLCGLCLVLFVYTVGVNTFSLIWSYLLSSIITHEFKRCSKMLHDCVKNPETVRRNFEMVRSHHQTLCRMVDKVDNCVCASSAIYVVEFIFMIVLYSYGLMCDAAMINSAPLEMVTALFWIFCCLLGLAVLARGGIMINQSAHKITKKIHDIDLTNLNSETIGQINTLLHRVGGEPIGFTVLKIFVIDRNTILTILGLLITYFLLIVQMYPPSKANQWLVPPQSQGVSTNQLTTVDITIINKVTEELFLLG